MINVELNAETIKIISQGVADVVFDDGCYSFLRFNKKEADVIGSENVYHTAGVQMEFNTDGDSLYLKVYTIPTQIRSYFSFDIFKNGKFIGSIKNISESERVGSYATAKYLSGSFEETFPLSKGEKTVRIVFPHSVAAKIEKFEINGASFITPVKKNKILVAYGDSITQGYDSVHPSNTYAMRLAEALGAELFNKGIGGSQFPPSLADVPDGLKPDWVTVAYGTNDWKNVTSDIFSNKADSFLEALINKYSNAPIYVISPIWRKDYKDDTEFGEFLSIGEILKEICQKYNRVKFVSGFDLVPHDEKFFGDLALHPNDTGFEYYLNNLIKYIN